jgi:hypothetical protein
MTEEIETLRAALLEIVQMADECHGYATKTHLRLDTLVSKHRHLVEHQHCYERSVSGIYKCACGSIKHAPIGRR